MILAREGLVIFTQQLQHVVTLAIARATPLPFPMYASALQNPIVFKWDLDVLAALHLRRRRRAERIVRRHDHEGEHHLADDVQDRVRNHLRHAKATNGHTDRGGEQEERYGGTEEKVAESVTECQASVGGPHAIDTRIAASDSANRLRPPPQSSRQ